MPDAEDDDLAEMLPDGQWHVTVCEHCGIRLEHTTINPRYLEIALAVHALGHCGGERRDVIEVLGDALGLNGR